MKNKLSIRIIGLISVVTYATLGGALMSCRGESETFINPIYQFSEDMTLKEKCDHIEQTVVEAKESCQSNRRPVRAVGDVSGEKYCCIFANSCFIPPIFNEIHWRRSSGVGEINADDELCDAQLATQGYSAEELNSYFQLAFEEGNQCLPRNHSYVPRTEDIQGLRFDGARTDVVVRYTKDANEKLVSTPYAYQCLDPRQNGTIPVEICSVDIDEVPKLKDCPAKNVEFYIYDPDATTPESFQKPNRKYEGTLTREASSELGAVVYDISDGVATIQ